MHGEWCTDHVPSWRQEARGASGVCSVHHLLRHVEISGSTGECSRTWII